ncbi:Focal adhesion kinase 1 [Sciurus carolinensis]|uniref:Focal adhesion kinase 1 n=1 Tax=Sciurus carolinensis TaxID=30640 RepID=A0AA41NE51_SCICA|nr:Focal adhesion kinase 1 [Sciurus carolinensis]
MAGSIYPGPPSLMDQSESWNHRPQEIPMCQPNVEDSVALDLRGMGQEISLPPTANLDPSNDKVYENVTGLVKAAIKMSSKIQPVPPEDYVPMIKIAQKLLNSDLGELISKMQLAQQCAMTRLQQEYKKQMLTAAHALMVDAKHLLDFIDQA